MRQSVSGQSSGTSHGGGGIVGGKAAVLRRETEVKKRNLNLRTISEIPFARSAVFSSTNS